MSIISHLRSLKHHFPPSRQLLRTLARTMKWGKSNLILLHQILKLLPRSDTILLLLTFHWPKQVKRPNLTLRWWGRITFLAVLVVAQSCLTLYNPVDCSTPSFPVLHCLPELAQTHVHWVGDAIQPSRPLTPYPAFNLSQHQGLFQWVSSLPQVAFQPDLCRLPQSLCRIDPFWNLCHKHTVDYRDMYNYALFSFKWTIMTILIGNTCFVPWTVLSALYKLTYLIFTTSLWGQCRCHRYFADGALESQRG